MHQNAKEFAEGAAVGQYIEGSAADCPYISPDLDRRKAWMDGFASVRPATSPASDPAKAKAEVATNEKRRPTGFDYAKSPVERVTNSPAR